MERVGGWFCGSQGPWELAPVWALACPRGPEGHLYGARGDELGGAAEPRLQGPGQAAGGPGGWAVTSLQRAPCRAWALGLCAAPLYVS